MTELTEIDAELRECGPFSVLDDAGRGMAARGCVVDYRRSGTTILESGQTSGELFLLLKGAAELRDDDGTLKARLGEGDSFGQIWVVVGGPVLHRVALIEDSVFCRFSTATVSSLRASNESFNAAITGAVEDRFSTVTSRLTAGPSPLSTVGPSPLAVSVGSLANRPALSTPPETTIRRAAGLMTERGASSILVQDRNGDVLGLVTDRDLRRRAVAAGLDTSMPLTEIMTSEVVTVGESTPSYQALLTMAEHNIHHLPVVDDNDRTVAVLSLSDLHLASNSDPVLVVGQVTKADSPDSVAEAAARVPTMVRHLMEADALAETVGRMVTSITDAATRRLCQLGEARFGKPPMAYAFICFGSQARQEQTAYSDQDNAVILARSPDVDEEAYFAQLAAFVSDGLDACGYRYCPGDIMATNPKWMGSLDRWHSYLDAWVTSPTPDAVLNAAVFMDARHLYGTTELTNRYRSACLERAASSPLFVGHLAAAGAEFTPPIGFFRRFVLEKDGDQKDTVDLKTRGSAPVMELARTMSLANKIEPLNTFDRLRALGTSGILASDDADDLVAALEHIVYHRLQHQRQQLEAGKAPDNNLDPSDLTGLERGNLKRAFVTIARQQDALRRRFSTDQMG